ncbi:MAG: transposase [Leptolyngbyaceae cyanobacterium]
MPEARKGHFERLYQQISVQVLAFHEASYQFPDVRPQNPIPYQAERNLQITAAQYFEHQTTRSVVESLNQWLKLIRDSGYGFRNFERFR